MDFAVGVWRAVVCTAAALGVCAAFAQEPEPPPGRATVGGLLQPLSDLLPGMAEPPPPPLPPLEPSNDAGRAVVGTVATVSGRLAYSWTDGNERVTLLRGSCVVRHDQSTLLADEMVLWSRTTSDGEQVTAYLDGNARLERPGESVTKPSMIVDLAADILEFQIGGQQIEADQSADPLYQRALVRREATPADATVRSVARPSVEGPILEPPEIGYERVQLRPADNRLRRVRVFPRSTIGFNVESIRAESTIPPEQVTVISGGVHVLIDGFDDTLGLVDLMADRVVIWTQSTSESFQSEQIQSAETPFTVYLEGNIIIRQDDRVIRAQRAIYDAREERALMERAELRAFVPQLNGDVRVRADSLRQIARGRYQGWNAWTTTSPFGKPGYRLQAREVFIEPRYDVNLQWLGAGTTVVDPATGMEMLETNWMRSYDNTVYIEDVPIMYSPYLAGPAEEIKIPLKKLTVGNDNRFGFQVKTVWDPFGLLGVEAPPDIELDLLADYYSKRGPGGGLGGRYHGDDLFGLDDTYRGNALGYFVLDDGHDRLGQLRNQIPPSTDQRWRIKWRHRHHLPIGTRINAELGILSDRNFLEQYFEREFDSSKDQENLLYATQSLDPWGMGNWGVELLGMAPINDFETQTGWYPKADLWGLSEPLFDGRLSWSSHTMAGYGDIQPASPDEYVDERFFSPLPYTPDVEGATFMTRHQLDLPLPVGPFSIVPFAMGEAAAWEQAMDGNDLGRLTGSVGTRASIQFQRVFPGVFHRQLGLNGLAHKLRFEAEYRLTDTTASLDEIAQYTEFDDNAQERSRYRFPGAYFGGTLPPELDPRFYGVRSGLGTSLGSPYYELVDDQQVIRLAARQRLQTKTGPPGRLRIRDWMTFDTGLSLFPNAERDNFNENVGLIFADYGWHVSERTRLLVGAEYDMFDNAPQLWRIGLNSQRSRRGSMYVGLRHVEFGRQKSDILIGSYNYLMSPKWISTLSAYVDVKNPSNTGESVTLTRLGADFLIHLGIENNQNTENFGINFAIEPRFGNFRGEETMRLSSLVRPPINP